MHQVLYQLSFTFCLLLTDAAKAMLLISLAPLWAALLGRLVLKEKLPYRTVAALAASMLGVALVFIPRVLRVDTPRAPSTSPPMLDSLQGDLLAVATGFAQGASLTVNRHAALHWPKSDLTLATCISSLGKSPRTTSKSFRMHHLWVARSPAHVCLCCSLQLPSPSS